MPCSRKRSRSSEAIRAFSLSTFCPSSIRGIFFYLHESEIQFVPANTITFQTMTVRTLQIVVLDHKIVSAAPAILSLAGCLFRCDFRAGRGSRARADQGS